MQQSTYRRDIAWSLETNFRSHRFNEKHWGTNCGVLMGAGMTTNIIIDEERRNQQETWCYNQLTIPRTWTVMILVSDKGELERQGWKEINEHRVMGEIRWIQQSAYRTGDTTVLCCSWDVAELIVKQLWSGGVVGGSDAKAAKARRSKSGQINILRRRDQYGRQRNKANATINLPGNSGRRRAMETVRRSVLKMVGGENGEVRLSGKQ